MPRSPQRTPPDRIVVAGGGVAALEAVLALRVLAGPRPAIELIAPVRELAHRPASVAGPFGFGGPAPIALDDFCDGHGATFRQAGLESVDVAGRIVRCADGQTVPFDLLLIAVGAHLRQGVPGSLVFRGPDDAAALTEVLDEVADGRARHVVFAVPRRSSWPLPLYELTILAAVALRARGLAGHTLTLVTPEAHPLELFGPEAGAAITRMAAERGIGLRTGRAPRLARPGELVLDDGTVIEADRVVSIPVMEGRSVPGLPFNADGFIPVDDHGRVAGAEGVYAAGDATDFPVKQGGLATQQADAAAEVMAATLGVPGDPAPFRPVLRGLLLTGGAPLYLRAEPGAAAFALALQVPRGSLEVSRSAVGDRPLWWPPAKVAGRYLAPYLATARPPVLATEPMVDRYADRSPPADRVDRGEALDLALLLAEQDARCGDYAQAVHALDAAAALAGGALPAAFAEKRDRWLAMHASGRRGSPV